MLQAKGTTSLMIDEYADIVQQIEALTRRKDEIRETLGKKKQFQEANNMHRRDVVSVMMWLAGELTQVGHNHDFTKKSQERMFYRDFLATMNDGANFTDSEWYQLHVKAERHHLLSSCPEDVNLIDVLEMITDCVCAGMARSGEIRSLEIDNEILRKAVSNTVELIKSLIVVEVE